jgi:hypothetical protein
LGSCVCRGPPSRGDALNVKIIGARLEYWTLVVGPKSSKKDRHAINLSRHYPIRHVEYRRNVVFRRSLPIHKLFECSCDLGLSRLNADSVTQIFDWRLHQTSRVRLMEDLDPERSQRFAATRWWSGGIRTAGSLLALDARKSPKFRLFSA